MTNDSRKGWRYKLSTDANQRKRRDPERRRRDNHYRQHSTARYCHSKAHTPHRGPLELQHIGGLKKNPKNDRRTWMCRKHNREEAGINNGRSQTGKTPAQQRRTTKPHPRRPWWKFWWRNALLEE